MNNTKLPIIAIVGRTNVGKSSLYNRLLGRREAIVAREAGTTRDSLGAVIELNGKYAWLVDTAGLKKADDEFEATIQDQIQEATASADHILVVIEADKIISDEDRRIAKMALKSRKPVSLVVNKSDRNKRAKLEDFVKLGIKDIYLTSTTTKFGLDQLTSHLARVLPSKKYNYTTAIKVALLGRPNAGKSALFNRLAKKQQAIVADRAGTTRDVNRIQVKYHGQTIELMDTAGIRRQGKIEVGVEKFSVLRSLQAISEADICLLLTDVNELGVILDQRIAGLVKQAGKGLIIVVSKWDQASDKDAFTRDELAPQIAEYFRFTPWASLIFTSAKTGQNVTKIYDLIVETYQARQTKIPTTKLNKWLSQTVLRHPPSGLKNSQPKIKYVTQTNESNPTFKFFGRDVNQLHWSYKRHLETQLRQEFGFAGTAIFLDFIEN